MPTCPRSKERGRPAIVGKAETRSVRPSDHFAPDPFRFKNKILSLWKACFNRIALNIPHTVPEMPAVAHYPIKVIALPQTSRSTKTLVDRVSRKALPRVHKILNRVPVQDREQGVHVIRHHDKCMLCAPLAFKKAQTRTYNLRNLRISKQTSPMSAIQPSLDQRRKPLVVLGFFFVAPRLRVHEQPSISLSGPSIKLGQRNRVPQPKRNEIGRSRLFPMRQQRGTPFNFFPGIEEAELIGWSGHRMKISHLQTRVNSEL